MGSAKESLAIDALSQVPGLDLAAFAGLQLQVSLKQRARRLRLAVRNAQVELVIPPGLDGRAVHRFVDQHRDWIAKHQRTQNADIERAQQALCLDPRQPRAPVWGLSRPICCHSGPPGMVVADQAIKVGLNPQRSGADRALARLLRAGLLSQLRERAMQRLPQWQQQLGLRSSAIRIRPMRSLWGSLSPRGAVSLNLGLVFLPGHYADYVLAHELAHLRQRNHSPAFWRVVAELYPDWRTARAGLRAEHGYVQALLDLLSATASPARAS